MADLGDHTDGPPEPVETTEPPAAPAGPGPLLAHLETALIVLGVCAMAFLIPHTIFGDGAARHRELVELLEHRRLSGDSYSMIMPLLAVPLWFAGRLAWTRETWLAQFNLLLFALALVVTYRLLRDRMDRTLLRRFLLLLTAGTMVGAHVTNFYGEMLTAAAVAVGILAALVRSGSAPWIAVVIGAANTPASLVGLGLVSAERMVTRRRLRYLAIAVAGAALVCGEAWLRRGGPFVTGHESAQPAPTVMPYTDRIGFSYPFLLGLVSILFSFGRGLVFYLPGLLLPVRRRLAELHDPARVDLFRGYLLWLLFLAGLVLVYSKWWAWYGGVYWGPRYFLIGIFPASLALAVALSYRRASALADLGTLAVLTLSVWIGVSSTVYQMTWPMVCYENAYALEALCHYVPEFSGLWYPFVARPPLGPGQLAYLAYFIVVFAYLATPVIVRLADKLGPRLATLRPLLSPSRWHF